MEQWPTQLFFLRKEPFKNDFALLRLASLARADVLYMR